MNKIILVFLSLLLLFAHFSKGNTVTTLLQHRAVPSTTEPIPIFLQRADSLMSSLISLYLGGPRDVWNSTYPNATGPYWNGDALVWGQGGGFSAYVALREASIGVRDYESKYAQLDHRMLTSIDHFRTIENGIEGYAVYPAPGNERFYDDNVWIGLDMIDLYLLTQDNQYLDRAKMVWKLLEKGTDQIMGGGVYWKEFPDQSKSKHTCSTAPTAVFAAKMYLATHETSYLESAQSLYAWCKKILQDPDDYLYWDNVRLSDETDPHSEMIISKAKYTYNSGQPMQAAALLYKITGEEHYLTDAQHIAEAAYKKWFRPFHSDITDQSFMILEPGHVWFQAILMRGYVELYKIDKNRTYISAYENTLSHAWLSDCRNRTTQLLNSDFRGGTSQNNWEILYEGACVEMLARIASLQRDKL